MTPKFGDRMQPGDDVTVRGWAYALCTKVVQNAAYLTRAGDHGRIERVVDSNAVIVRFASGYAAPVHPSCVYPGGGS